MYCRDFKTNYTGSFLMNFFTYLGPTFLMKNQRLTGVNK